MHEGEDPNRMGLVLEWVYGTIVSTAEKARDGAKRALGQLLLTLVCRACVIRLATCTLDDVPFLLHNILAAHSYV